MNITRIPQTDSSSLLTNTSSHLCPLCGAGAEPGWVQREGKGRRGEQTGQRADLIYYLPGNFTLFQRPKRRILVGDPGCESGVLVGWSSCASPVLSLSLSPAVPALSCCSCPCHRPCWPCPVPVPVPGRASPALPQEGLRTRSWPRRSR